MDWNMISRRILRSERTLSAPAMSAGVSPVDVSRYSWKLRFSFPTFKSQFRNWSPSTNMDISWVIGVYPPSHHPFFIRDFPWKKPSSYWSSSMAMETPYGLRSFGALTRSEPHLFIPPSHPLVWCADGEIDLLLKSWMIVDFDPKNHRQHRP